MQAKKLISWLIAVSLGFGLVNAALDQHYLPSTMINTAQISDTTNQSRNIGGNASNSGIISQNTVDSLIGGAEMLTKMFTTAIGLVGSVSVVFGCLAAFGITDDWVAALAVMFGLAVFWGLFQWLTGRTLKTEE